MDLFHVIILSVIEGLTEFLPVSSTGHLVLTSHFLGIAENDFVKTFEVVIQFGAILAIVALYWRTLFLRRSFWPKLFLAFLPTALIGFTLYPLIKNVLLSSPLITLAALIIGGVLLIIVEKIHTEKEHHATDLSHLTNRQVIMIGFFQALAVVPGVSRSASTIIGGMLMGAKRKTAVEFSFLIAVPTMAVASGYDLLESHQAITSSTLPLLLIGCGVSFIVALIAVKYFVKFVQHHTFVPFGIYRIVFGILYSFILFL